MSRDQDLEYEQRSGGTCVRSPVRVWGTDTAPSPPLPADSSPLSFYASIPVSSKT